MEETIQKTTEELLAKLEIKANVVVDQDEQKAYHVRIETPESGLLIGYHGQTLESLQLILNLILAKKLKEWQRVVVHVGDYREKRTSYLENLAVQVAERVTQTGKEEILPEMSSFERRLVHLALSGHPEVTTESTGDTSQRRIAIKPK